MSKTTRNDIAALILLFCSIVILLPSGGGGGGLSGFHAVILRGVQPMSPSQAAVVNSQVLEDEVTEQGGTYAVVWREQESPAEYSEQVAKLAAYDNRPVWWLGGADAVVASYGPVPETLPEAVAAVRTARGAR